MEISTPRFVQLLTEAQEWDAKYTELCHAQQEWLLENFIFADRFVEYASAENRRRWDIPKVVYGRPYTICG